MERRGDPARDRAELLFFAYYQRRPDRSIARLHADLTAIGVRISLATLKRYSSKYGWQDRVAGLDSEVRKQQSQRGVDHVLAMNDRHAQLARAMQGAGGTALQRLLANDARLAGLKAADIARLVDLGLRAERSAVGASSDRREIIVETWNDVVVSVVQAFNEINGESDRATRERLFARRIDHLVDARLAEMAEKED